jgi:hypothetical protein
MGKFVMRMTTKHGNIDNTWPDFAIEPRNVRLSLATNGVNPFGDKNNA